MGRGRTEKLDYAKILMQITAMAAIGLNIVDISKIFGVDPSTLHRYMNRHPELRHAYNRGKEAGQVDLKLKAYKQAQEGDGKMIKYVLSNISDWTEKPLIDASKHVNVDQRSVNIVTVDIKKLAEQLKEVNDVEQLSQITRLLSESIGMPEAAAAGDVKE